MKPPIISRRISAALIPVLATIGADPPRPLSILAVMHRQYTVSKAPLKTVARESKAEAPDWEKVREAGATFSALAETLATRTPRKGGEESWRKFIDAHLADAKALSAAAEARDAAALREAHRRIAQSCDACHKAHRGRRGD